VKTPIVYRLSLTPLGTQFAVGFSNYEYDPAVAADSSGNFVVVWWSPFPDDGSGKGIFGHRFDSSCVPVAPQFRVNTYTTTVQEYAAVAAVAAGNFIVVWESNLQDGSEDGVFGQRYNQIVPVELMHFRVE